MQLSEGLRNEEDAERNSGKGQSPQARLDAEEKTTCPEDKSLVHNLILDDVRSMGGGQLGNTERLLASAEECGMTLIFSNESSQLREQKVCIHLAACYHLFINWTNCAVYTAGKVYKAHNRGGYLLKEF